MASDDSLPTLKILLIGPSGAGKSASTIGIDFKAGQERFRTLSTSYYRGAHGVILVYDTSSRTSFASMETWFDEVEMNTVSGVALYLVGTKTDRPRAVAADEGRALAAAHGACGFCEVSAKTSDNVREPFVEVVDAVVGDPALMREADRGREGAVRVADGVADSSGASCSC
ncbi:hypothetical protein VSDG_07209 [Cytospora chrysosperma]|uniref:Ras-related protein Rab-18 n=1 Tax=Cytospora chrysosperma TaxID=252740 RepID=A0A423VKK4_CYTCH|nr:hypothetical protein VSDG_07209 [Valsa sordida]